MGKLGQWLQVGANIGILAGLILVSLQIQQQAEITTASMYSEHMSSWISVDQSLQSENFAETLAKSLSRPEELTDAEILEINGYLWSNLDQLNRRAALLDMGVFGMSLDEELASSIQMMFGNRFAQAWWAESRQGWNPAVVAAVDRAIAGHGDLIQHSQTQLARIRARLQADTLD